MGAFLAIRNGGKTDENGALRFLRRASSNGQGPIQAADLQVTQHSTPNASIDLAVGDLVISYQDYIFYTWIDAIAVVNITANASGNPRIDALVAYVDLSVVSSVSNNNPNALKFMDVNGTPAGSPVTPNDSAIQSAVGAGNPFYRLADIAVANGFATIVNANITDKRTRFLLGNSGAIPPFSVSGSLAVANQLATNWIVPPGISAISRLDAVAITGPTGAGLTLRLYNVTQARDVGTVTIAAGSRIGSNSSMTNASLNTGDEIRFDCTAVGSTITGADVLVQPSA